MTMIIMNDKDNIYSAKCLYWRLPVFVFFNNQLLADLATIKAPTNKISKEAYNSKNMAIWGFYLKKFSPSEKG